MQSRVGSAALTTSVTLQTFFAKSFTVGALPQIATLTALFDQYRISLVEFWLFPQESAQGTNAGEVAVVTDYDDATALTTFDQATEYQNCTIGTLRAGFYRKFVPHVASAVYGSGVFTSFANVTAPWIDAASTAVEHYGIKGAATVTTAVVVYDIMYRLTTEWRNVR